MRRHHGSPSGPLWEIAEPLLRVDKLREGWFPIDGIPAVMGAATHQQWLVMGQADRLWRNIGWVLRSIRDHLGIDPGVWHHQRGFLLNFAGCFLQQKRGQLVWVQALPRRKTFRTPVADGESGRSQKLVYPPKYRFHAACINDSELDLAFNLRMPGRGMLLGAESPPDSDQEPFWAAVTVSRSVPGGLPIREEWFFAAYEQDRDRIMGGSVPILEQFFKDQVQEAPIVSFCALDPAGIGLQAHCLSLHPQSGVILDIRQSRSYLEHHCRSAPHNHSGLGRLVFGERWSS